MIVPWYLLAFGSAVIWGIHYVILQYALRFISPQGALLLTTIPSFLIAAVWFKTLQEDVSLLLAMEWSAKLPIFGLMFTSMSATLILYHAIIAKSAVHAGLIEITYPIFIVIFSLIFLGTTVINLNTVLGGLMILGGSWLVILKG